MKIILFLTLLTMSLNSMAANLESIEVLEIINQEKELIAKLKDTKLTPKGYFFIYLDKSDPKTVDHLTLLMSKNKYKDGKLTLKIRSFSATIPGSMYRNKDVEFSGEISKKNLLP